MTDFSPNDERKAVAESERLERINRAGPTWRMLVDVFGEDSLWVKVRGSGLIVRGEVMANGTVWPRGEVRFKVCRPDLPPEMNKRRLRVFNEMMRDRRLMQTEDMHRKDAETEHAVWTDSDGVKRVAPAEYEEMQRKKDEARKR